MTTAVCLRYNKITLRLKLVLLLCPLGFVLNNSRFRFVSARFSVLTLFSLVKLSENRLCARRCCGDKRDSKQSSFTWRSCCLVGYRIRGFESGDAVEERASKKCSFVWRSCCLVGYRRRGFERGDAVEECIFLPYKKYYHRILKKQF